MSATRLLFCRAGSWTLLRKAPARAGRVLSSRGLAAILAMERRAWLKDAGHRLTFAESFSNDGPDDGGHYVDVASVAEAAQALEEALALRERKAKSGLTVERKVLAFCEAYSGLHAKEDILKALATRSVDRGLVRYLSEQYAQLHGGTSVDAPLRLEEELRDALAPPYVWLFEKIGGLEGGVKFLVDFR